MSATLHGGPWDGGHWPPSVPGAEWFTHEFVPGERLVARDNRQLTGPGIGVLVVVLAAGAPLPPDAAFVYECRADGDLWATS